MGLEEFQSERLNEVSPEEAVIFDGQKFLRSLHAWLKINPPASRVQDMRQFMFSAFEVTTALTVVPANSGSMAAACAKPLLDAALYPVPQKENPAQ